VNPLSRSERHSATNAAALPALMAAIGTIAGEGSRAGSPLEGKVDSRFAIMGHSMGGGGTLIAADSHSGELRAAIPLTPWSSSPTSFPGVTVPTLFIAGQLDNIAGVAQHAWPFYQSITNSHPRTYVEFAGADHFVANNPNLNGTVARYALSWLKVHVNGDTRYEQFLVQDAAFSRYDSAP
jgi:alpha-beta hydrolase superfamily lysophospholipase